MELVAPPPFPYTLRPDNSEQFLCSRDSFRRAIAERDIRGKVQLAAVVTDAVGRDFWSDWVEWDTEEKDQ